MSSQPDPPAAPSHETPLGSPAVAAAVFASPNMRLEETLAAIGRQVYAPAQVIIVGGSEGNQSHLRVSGPEEVISHLADGIDFIWWVHGDARPRPDALVALVRETIRNDAAVAGSKILTADDQLESVGGATDVFGDPYTGLDPGELDLEQYDIVREVAFVSAASLLVRRDLLRGLGGFDLRLPLEVAGLDLCQRARVAGGRVIVVPSSEVFHQSPCAASAPAWKEQGGRHKAMLVAYRPITLAWVVPLGVLIGLADGIGRIALGRFDPLLGAVLSWFWVLTQLPSVLVARKRLERVRSLGDEELFRFQVAGSSRMRRLASEFGERFNRALDEEESGSLAERARSAWRRPSFAFGLVSAMALLVATRGIWFGDPPQVGFLLPPGQGGLAAAYGGGSNPAGFGSESVAPPLVGVASLMEGLLGRRPSLTVALLTLAASGLALTGMARLARRAGAGTVGSAIAGWAYLGAATAIAVAESGNWPAILAAGPLPWALDAVLASPGTDWRRRVGRYALGGLAAGMVAVAYPPLLVVVPLAAVVWSAAARRPTALIAGLSVSVLGLGLILPYIVGGDLYEVVLAGVRPRIGTEPLWLAAIALGSVASATWAIRSRLPGVGTAAVLIGGGYLFSRLPTVLPGGAVVGLLAAALGTGLMASIVVELGLPRLRFAPAVLSILFLIPAFLVIGQGRLGFPSDAWAGRLDFVGTLSSDEEPGRVLLIGPPGSLPGGSRSLYGFEYRTIDGGMATLTDAYLGSPGPEDRDLAQTIAENLLGGVDLRPGQALARLGIEWLMIVPGSTFPEEVLNRQVDLARRPVATEMAAYQNLAPVDPPAPNAVIDSRLRASGWVSLGIAVLLAVAAYWGRIRVPVRAAVPGRVEEMAVVS